MTRKKRDENKPQAPDTAGEQPEATAEAGPQESPSEPQATTSAAETGTAQPEEQAAVPGGPVAPTPENQQAEAATPSAAAPEPVAATPETQRAEAEPPAAQPATPEPAAAPRRNGVSAGYAFFLGLLAALVVTGLTMTATWFLRDHVTQAFGPGGRIDAIEGRATQTDQRIDQLASRIDGVERTLGLLREDVAGLRQQAPAAAPGGNADAGRLDEMAQRLQTLEGTQASRVDPAQVAALDQDLQRLAKELAQVQESVAGLSKSAADAATVLRLSDRVEAAEGAVRQAQSRVNTAQNLLLAVGQLREALNRGEGFDAELRAVGAIGGNDPQLAQPVEKLTPLAATGVPTRTALAERFEALSGRIVRADFGPEEEGLWRQTVQRLASVVTVRRTEGDVAGESTAAVVARAEGALGKGNLAGAVQQLKTLQGHAAQTAAPWLKDAEARLAAETALSELTAHVVAQTKAGG